MRAESIVSEFQTQKVTVGSTAAPIVQTGTMKCFRGVYVKASVDNTVAVYIGNNDQVGTHGYELKAGDEILVPIDLPEKIWGIAASDQILYLLLA